MGELWGPIAGFSRGGCGALRAAAPRRGNSVSRARDVHRVRRSRARAGRLRVAAAGKTLAGDLPRAWSLSRGGGSGTHRRRRWEGRWRWRPRPSRDRPYWRPAAAFPLASRESGSFSPRRNARRRHACGFAVGGADKEFVKAGRLVSAGWRGLAGARHVRREWTPVVHPRHASEDTAERKLADERGRDEGSGRTLTSPVQLGRQTSPPWRSRRDARRLTHRRRARNRVPRARDALDVPNDARTPVAADAAQPVVAASMTVASEPAPPSDESPLPLSLPLTVRRRKRSATRRGKRREEAEASAPRALARDLTPRNPKCPSRAVCSDPTTRSTLRSVVMAEPPAAFTTTCSEGPKIRRQWP